MAPIEPLLKTGNREAFRVKGSVLRGYVAVLSREGTLSAVSARVSPETRALLRDPPLASVWIDPAPLDELMAAVSVDGGDAAVRRIAREGLRQGVLPVLRSSIEGLLRLFGTSPSSLYRRLDTVAGTTMKGVCFRFTEGEGRAGIIEADLYDPALNLLRYQRFAGAFEVLGELCGERVEVSEPEVIAREPWGTRARFLVRW